MKFGIIGGSGLYDIETMENIEIKAVETPFGKPSSELLTGNLDDTEVVFLPRHGKGHTILPGELNHKANIYALKAVGVTHILSVSAVGSLKEELKPRDIVIVDQYFDRTKNNLNHTFFGSGAVAHISFGDPVCPELQKLAFEATKNAIKSSESDVKVHFGGTYVNMEGPAFSTKAESKIYKSWGLDVIGMTNMAEAKLAREAELCYCTIAMVTDYDSWHPDHDSVTIDMIIANLVANVKISKDIIRSAVSLKSLLKNQCSCNSALSSALITDKETIPDATKDKLNLLIGKYL